MDGCSFPEPQTACNGASRQEEDEASIPWDLQTGSAGYRQCDLLTSSTLLTWPVDRAPLPIHRSTSVFCCFFFVVVKQQVDFVLAVDH